MSSKTNEVLRARHDFEYFATNDNFVDQDEFHPEKGFVLKDYHREWLDALENNRKVAITAFTGSGKTSVPGVLYPLWRAFKEPGFEVLVVSATMQQATEILKKIKHHINQSEYLSDLKPEDRGATWNQTSAELTNGSEIHCKPLSDKVKGTHADLAVCTPGYSRVETPDGAKRIDEVEKGEKVKTHKGEFKEVKKVMSRQTTETGYEIHAGGQRLRLTQEHPLRVKGDWVKAENLEEGQILEYPVDLEGYNKELSLKNKGKKELDVELDRELAELLGWYMAEGSLDKRGIRITNADEDYLERVKYLYDVCFGGNITVDDHHDWATTLTYSSVDLRDAFEEWFNTGAKNKVVPEIIKQGPEVVKASFIRGWAKGDGRDNYDSKGLLKSTVIHSASKEAIENLEDLLDEIGCGYKRYKYSNEDSTYGGGEIYRVRIKRRGAQKLRALTNERLREGKLIMPVDKINKARVSDWCRNHKVYNLEVEDHNSYVVNGISTHNCDEAAEYDDHEFFQRYVRTRVESQGGKLCLISTPVNENDLMSDVSSGTMDHECPDCGMAADKQGEDFFCMNKTCDNYGEEVEPFFDPNISEKGYWNKTYPVWEEVDSLDADPNAFEVADKTVRPVFPENFDERSIRELRDEDMTMFQKEYLCEPLAVEGDLFDPNDIIELYDKEEQFEKNAREDCEYYMGCDFAVSRQGDYSVFTIIEVPPDDKPIIRYMQRLRGVDLASQEERIRNLHDIFGFRKIVIDESNFGVRTKRELIQSGLPIKGQTFESKARNGLLIGLKTSIEKGEFRIPRGSERAKQKTDVLYNELLGFGTSETDSGKETYKSTAKHDDTVMSLAMVIDNIDESREVDAMIAY